MNDQQYKIEKIVRVIDKLIENAFGHIRYITSGTFSLIISSKNVYFVFTLLNNVSQINTKTIILQSSADDKFVV